MKKLTSKIITFKLVDVEGAVQSSPNTFEIREVEGFDTVGITMQRDTDADGLMYEFSDDETEFGFSRSMEKEVIDPYSFLYSIFRVKGVDANVELLVTSKEYESSTEETIYRGSLDMSTMTVERTTIYVSCRRVDFDDKFRTSIDKKYNLVPYLQNKTSTFLHGITRDAKSILIADTETQAEITSIPTDVEHYFWMPFNTTDTSNIDQVEGLVKNNLTFTTLVPDGNGVDGGYVLGGTELRRGTYNLKINSLTFDIVLEEDTQTWGAGTTEMNFIVRLRRSDGTIDNILNYVDPRLIPASDQGTNNTIRYTYNIPDVDYTFDVVEGDALYIYMETETEHEADRFRVENTSGTLEINSTVDYNSSLADTWSTPNIFRTLVDNMTGIPNSVMSSTLLGKLIRFMQTNGYKLRRYTEKDELITSFKEQFNGYLRPLFGAGYAIVDDGGVQRMMLEHREHFYQDTEIIQLGELVRGSYTIEADTSLIYNEIESGYKNYPKSTDEHREGNNSEFNTHHLFQTPIERHKNKLSLISDVTAAGYSINSQREEQFNTNPPKTTSDDEKMFVIKCKDVVELTMSNFDHGMINSSSGGDTGRLIPYSNADDFRVFEVGDRITLNGAAGNNGETMTVLGFTDTGAVELERDLGVFDTTSRQTTTVTVGFDSTKALSESDEPVLSSTGITHIDTVFNAGITPRTSILNHSKFINSGFVGKDQYEQLELSEAKLSSTATITYQTGTTDYINDEDGSSVDMNGNINLEHLNNNNRLFDGFVYHMEVDMKFDDVMLIRNNHLNMGDDDFGYISFIDPIDGSTKAGYLLEMVYTPFKEIVKFKLRGKYSPFGGRFDYVLDAPTS